MVSLSIQPVPCSNIVHTFWANDENKKKKKNVIVHTPATHYIGFGRRWTLDSIRIFQDVQRELDVLNGNENK